MNAPRVSVAIPLYNEEAVLPELYRRLRAVLANLPGGGHEILFVDDGSADRTLEILESLAKTDPQVRVAVLSRNFGHQAALTAALDEVSGEAVVLMDGDLQNTLKTIPLFLEQYAQGFDVVYAIRQQRKEPPVLRACYALFYSVISRLSEIELPRDAGDFSLSLGGSSTSASLTSTASIFARVEKLGRLPPERDPGCPRHAYAGKSVGLANCWRWPPTEYLVLRRPAAGGIADWRVSRRLRIADVSRFMRSRSTCSSGRDPPRASPH